MSGDTYTVGFITPSDDLIDGYIIYYKIYIDGSSNIKSDEDQFDKSDNEIQSGTSLLKKLNFFKLGFKGESSNDNFYTIPWNGSGNKIVFDFFYALNQSSDPVLYIDGTDYSTILGVPARGVKYKDVYSGGDSTYDTFKRFIKNYEFDPYLDEDLKLIDSKLSTVSANKIEIAFVAISTGISASTLEQMMSIPVYLGTVEINDVRDNNSNTKTDT